MSTRWLANQANEGRSHFPHNFPSSYEYLILHQSESSCAHWTVIWVPPLIKLAIQFRLVISSKHTIQSLLKTRLFGSVFGSLTNHMTLNYRRFNKKKWVNEGCLLYSLRVVHCMCYLVSLTKILGVAQCYSITMLRGTNTIPRNIFIFILMVKNV